MEHGNDEITTELAARILRRVARIRRTVRRNPDLNEAAYTILMYLDDITNLVHFNDPYGDPEVTMTRRATHPPIVPSTPLESSFQGIVEDTP